MSDKYANIELVIKSESLLTLGNSVNYKKTANWNNTLNGNVTSVSGSNNGDASYYGLYDTFGQLYEWTETSDINYPQQKIIRGGSYIDQNEHDLRAIKKFLFYDVLSEGCFGFRICSYTNPDSFDNFVEVSGNISDSNNDTNLYDDCYFDNIDTNVYVDPKTLKDIGIVPYIFNISKYLITNEEYCDYLNSVDASGINKEIYDYRMESTNIGGIRIRKSYENPQDNNYYAIKNNMSNKPATFITWDKAAKYCNWLSNGSISDMSSTVSGSYNMKPIEYISLVSDVSLTTEEQDILLKGIPGIADISIDGYELNVGDKILLKNEDIEYNGIYIVVSNTDATNANEYPFYLSRDLSYTLGGQVFKAKNGNNNKNRLFQVGNSCETLSYSQDLNYTKLYECDQGTEVYFDQIFTRANNAKYFLPTNNEWHKAALYDFSLNKYWKYSTKSDETPLSVVCNKQGDAVYPAGYFYPSEKTFPVIIKKTAGSSGGGDNGGDNGGGTIQQLSGLSANISYFSTPADFQKYIYFINVDISGVKSGRVYNYEFSAASGTNWPTYISPKSGSFTPTNNGIYQIENILKFCPVSRLDSNNIVCNSNLDFNLDETTIQSISEQGSGFLDLNISVSGDNKLIKNNIIIETTNAPIVPKDDIIDVKIQTPSNEPNAIVVYEDACEQYIPIVTVASTGNSHTKLGKKYNYEFFTDNINVSIVPKSGTFSISQPYTKITNILKLNGEDNCKLYIKCYSENHDPEQAYIHDYINIICQSNCNSITY